MLRTEQKSSKLLSLLLSVLLVLSAVAPLSVGATDNTEGASENRGKISMVFLGTGDNPDPSAASFDSSAWTAGQEFWVGLTLNDCTNVDKVAYQAGKPSHFTNTNDEGTHNSALSGITLVTAGFDYDSRYVTPVFYEDGNEVAWDKDNMSDAQYMLNLSFKTLPRISEAGYNMQNMSLVTEIEADGSARPTGIDSATRILTQIVQTSTRDAIFGHNKVVDDEPVYISAMKFKLKDVPTAAGAKVVAATLNSANFTLSAGSNGDRWKAQWNEDRGTTPDENLKNHFDYTGDINFFPATYTIKYNLNDTDTENQATYSGDENDLTTQTVVEDKAIDSYLPDSTKLTKPGKLFAGWYLDAAGSDNKKFTAGENGTVVTADMVNESNELLVYAKWVDGYSITIDPNGGTLTLAAGDTTTTDPTKPFVKEYAKSETADPTNDKFPTGVTRDGYRLSTVSTIGTWNTKANGTGTAYTGTLADYPYPQASTELYAQWEPDGSKPTVTVTFNENGGAATPTPETVTINKGDSIVEGSMPDTPTRDGYTFKEWNTKKNGSGKTFVAKKTGVESQDPAATVVDENMILYAQWNVAKDQTPVKVTFSAPDADADKGPKPTEVTVKTGDPIGVERMPDEPERTGFVFLGWKNGTDDFTGETPVNTSITVTANWAAGVGAKFYKNDGGTDEPTIVMVEKGKAIPDGKIPTVTHKDGGYVLAGWNTEENGGGTDLNSSYTVPADATNDTVRFYAVWQAAKDTNGDGVPDEPLAPDTDAITVNFDKNTTDATAVVKPAVRYLKNGHTKIEQIPSDMPSGTRTKYKVTGWNTMPGGTGVSVDKTTDLTQLPTYNVAAKSVTLYAQWSVDNTKLEPTDKVITVRTHKKLGDTAILKSYQVVAGDKLGTALDDPALTGFTFEGWETTNGATPPATIAFDPLDTEIVEANATTENDALFYDVYATWALDEVNKYTVEVTLGNIETTYDGDAHGVTVTKIEAVAEDNTRTDITSFFDITETTEDYLITYKQLTDGSGADVSGTSTEGPAPTNAGTYEVEVTFTVVEADVNAYHAAGISDTSPFEPVLTINPADVTFALDTANGGSQSAKISDTPKTIKMTASYTLKGVSDTLTQGTDFTVEFAQLSGTVTWENATEWDTIGSTNDEIGEYVARVRMTGNGINFKPAAFTGLQFHCGAEATVDVQARALKFTVTPDIELSGLLVADSTVTDFTNPDNLKQLYNASTLADDAKTNFAVATHEYYVSAGVGENIKIQFAGTFGDNTTVTLQKGSGTPEDIAPKADSKPVAGTTNEIVLAAADGTVTGGFNNTIVIKLNGETSTAEQTYTIHVRQLAEAKITLAYGNSPVGMIMADNEKYADEAAKTAAIDAFQETRIFSGVTENRVYNEKAWESYTEFISNDDGSKSPYDGDLDPYAMVLFQRRAFRDVGFSATDSLGNAVAENQITRTMQVIACNDGVPTYDDTRDNARTIDISINEAVDYLAKDIMEYNIRPNVYIMKYSFTDALTGVVEIERKVIIISELGDAIINANDVVNALDGNAIISGYTAMQSANSLYAFRVCDALMNANNVVNALDGNTVISSYSRLQPFYNNLYKTFNKDYFKNLENN